MQTRANLKPTPTTNRSHCCGVIPRGCVPSFGEGGTLLHKHIKSLLSSNARPKGPTAVQAASLALCFSGYCKQHIIYLE